MFIVTTKRNIIGDVIWSYNIKSALVHIHEELMWPAEPRPDYFLPRSAFALPKFKDQSSNASLTAIIDQLSIAKRWRPDDPQAYRLTGQIYAAQHEWQRASESFAYAYSLSPHNPLLPWETVLALDQMKDQGLPSQSSFINTGLDSVYFLVIADSFLQEGDFSIANRTYQRALISSDSRDIHKQPFDVLFAETIAALMSDDAHASEFLSVARQKDPSFEVYTVTNTLHIKGEQLRWMTPVDPPTITFGTPLNYPYGGPNGVLWFTGQAAALISVEQSGSYTLSVNALHHVPPPVEIAIGIDGVQRKVAALARGDNSWETLMLPITLRQGFHTINIWFLNNDVVGNQDRDGIIEWVALQN